MRTLATIQKIINIRPIEGADKIAVADVLGWEVVIRKDEFQIGDLCVYIEVDSIVPQREEFEFLKQRKYRVRTIKLRKQVSQGLCLPLSICKEYGLKEGDDVTEIMGIVKYDPEGDKEKVLQAQADALNKNRIDKYLKRFNWYRRLFTKAGKRGWPPFIKKTDEERIQRIPWICEKEKGTKFVYTEKLDGQSATYALLKLKKRFWQFKDKFEFIVCSRNVNLKTPDNSSYWRIARQYDIENILKNIISQQDEFVILQGEIIGEGIQSNKYKIKGIDFYAFNLIHSYFGAKDHIKMVVTLPDEIKVVPFIDIDILKDTIHDCIEEAKGKSLLVDIPREGVVIRNQDKKISFKIVNPDFLIRYEEEDEKWQEEQKLNMVNDNG